MPADRKQRSAVPLSVMESKANEELDQKKSTLKLPPQTSIDLLSPEDVSNQPRLSVGSLQSRRLSTASNLSRRSQDSDYQQFGSFSLAPGVPPAQTDESGDKTKVSNNDSFIRAVIPVFPLPIAILCLIFNCLIPGFGTMLSGMIVLCMKKNDFTKDHSPFMLLCTNVGVGMCQMGTVPFLLVGWFWSLAWGVYMINLSLELRKEEKENHRKEIQQKALNMLLGNQRGSTAGNSNSANALKALFGGSVAATAAE